MKKILTLMTVLVMLSTSTAYAQLCNGDFDCNGVQDGLDVIAFKADFGRFDCPECPPCENCQSWINEHIDDICVGFSCEGMLSAGGRWCDQRDGTVKDMTTGLVWLQDASCMGYMDWYAAIEQPITNLRSGDCIGTLIDGSVWGDWRLPTLSELEGVTVGDEYIRSSQMYKFTGVQSGGYWSSATSAFSTAYAWYVLMGNGYVDFGTKNGYVYVWPVRGGND